MMLSGAGLRRKRILFYFLALAAPVFAILVRLTLERRFGQLPPFLICYPVVALAALFGGLGVGLLATASSAVVVTYWALSPRGQFAVERTSDVVGLAIFCVMGIGISVISELYHRTRRQLATYEKERAVREAVRESEERFRALVTASSDVIYHMSPDWSEMRLLRSQSFLAETVTPSRNWLHKYIHPDDQSHVLDVIHEAIRTKSIFELEHRVLRADGTVGWTFSRAVPLLDATGEIVEWFGAASDISSRKVAEQALRYSEERLRQFIEHAPAALAVFDREMRYVCASRRWMSDYKLGDRDLRGALHYEIFPEIGEEWKEAHRRGLAGEVTRSAGDRFQRADGSEQWVRWEIQPWHDAAGEVGGIILFAEDITEVKRAETALQRSEQRLRSAQQIARVGAFDWDIRTGVEEWTPELEALYGLSPGSFAGTQPAWENLVHPEDRSDAVKRIECSLQTGAITEGEWRVVWPDGSVHWLAGRWQVSKDELGNPLHMTGFNIDITQRQLAEQALIRSEKLASVGRMAATIAHEVNNPLAGAVNAIYLASIDPAASPKIREILALADDELRRASHITQQTLGFYRENGKRIPVALPKLIDEVLSVYARKLQERGIVVQTRYNCGPCREGCETCFIVSSGEMRQVISNLLGNGIDALRDSGRIQIRVSRATNLQGDGQDIHLTIADNGCGIRAENLKRIFEPFFTTKESIGTGLGLWITQQLVRNHHGTIRVHSSDKGTVFRISIPATPMTDSESNAGNLEKIVTRIIPGAA